MIKLDGTLARPSLAAKCDKALGSTVARASPVLVAIAIALAGPSALAAGPTPASPAPVAPPAALPPSSTPPADGEAATRFKRGLQLFDEGDYTLALVEFERAYQLAPNYRALYNIALVNMQLGRYADATRTFEQYLHDGGDAVPADRRAQVGNTLNELRVRTATVDISVNVPNAEVALDGRPLEASRLHGPTLIDAGEHTLRATAPGYQAAFKTVTLAGADKATVRLQLVPVPPVHEAPQEKGRTLFWPGFVATGVLAAGAIVSGAVMLDARSRLNALQNTALPMTPPPSASEIAAAQKKRSDLASTVNSTALAADILSGLAVVAGGVSIYLSLRVDHSLKSPTIAITPQQVLLYGSF
jgi:Tetratricopeptide repeat/PEGA domain